MNTQVRMLNYPFKSNSRRYLLVFFLLALAISSDGQEDSLYLGAQFKDEILKVRWSSGDFDVLTEGFTNGYTVDVYRITEDGEIRIISTKLIPGMNGEIEKYLFTSSDSAAYVLYQHLMNKGLNLTDENEIQWKLVTLLFGLQDNFALTRALGMGTEFTDLDINFQYRIKVQLNLSHREIANEISIKYPFYETLPKPEKPSATCDQNKVSISGIMTHSAEYYSSYYLEKQTSSQAFIPVSIEPSIINYVNEKPYLYLLDSITSDGSTAYRWRGKDIWGEYGPYSEALTVMPCQYAYLAPQSVRVTELDDGNAMIEWEMPDELKHDLQGFFVYRSHEKFSQGSLMHDSNLPASQYSFVDHSPNTVSYYLVEALYKDGTRLASLNVLSALKDVTPPEIPTDLQVVFDTLQFIASLSWHDNSDDDLNGYRLYYSNARKGAKFLLENTTIQTTQRKDTIVKNILQNQRWYWVTSRDHHGNESLFSRPAELRFPDRFPPAPPRIHMINPSYQYVDIHWSGSPSVDVSAYTLMTRSSSYSDWIHQPLEGQRGENLIRDTSLLHGDTLVYKIMVVDSSGLVSESNQRTATLLQPIYLPEIPFYQAQLNDSILQITFDYPEKIKVRYWRLMAGHAPESMSTFRMYSPDELIIRKGIMKRDDPEPYSLYQINISNEAFFDAIFRLGVVEEQGSVSPMSEVFGVGDP